MSRSRFIIGLSGLDRGFAVSLLRDGDVVFAIEEDKLRRFKGLGFHDVQESGSRAIDAALAFVPVRIEGVDQVIYTPPIDAEPLTSRSHASQIEQFLIRRYGRSPEIRIVDHVRAHIAFERAVHGWSADVLMVGRTRAVYSRCESDSYEVDRDFPVVGFIENGARFMGLERERIHHLENMARFGEARFEQQVHELFREGTSPEKISAALSQITGTSGRRPEGTIEQVHYDLATSLFEVMCSEIIGLLRPLLEQEATDPVALCGGVFQSWRLNDKVASAYPKHRFAVSFAPGNPACAIGGPLAQAGQLPAERLTPFLGPRYDANEIKGVLDNCKARYAFHSDEETMDLTCDALAAGKMVGWFSGACEFGYRALGARSVLANPADAYSCDNLSSYLKRRPAYFAYAVAMKDESPQANTRSPYLSRSIHLPEYFDDSPVRLQTVSKLTTPGLHQLLEKFETKTGVAALLNTSLNYFDEPIACTPRDVLKTFYASGLDMLVMENFVLTKT